MSDKGELVFDPCDFAAAFGMRHDQNKAAADCANAKFRRWLEAQPVVYGTEYNIVNAQRPIEKFGTWFHYEQAGINEPSYKPPTHRARLCCIEKLESDSAESLLMEMVGVWERGEGLDLRLEHFIRRAKALKR